MSSIFFDAIKRGDRHEVERQLMVDPSLLHVKENGLSPILIAAYHNEPALASFLADKTVILTIFEAAATGKINQVIRLLARDPELVNAYSQDGFQPLGLASFFGQYDVADYLLKAGALPSSSAHNGLKATPLHSAAAGRHLQIVNLLIQHGADPNVREQNGFSPLHAAAQNGDVDIIRALLMGGADLTLKSTDGKTAMDVAMEAGHEKATVLLGEGVTKRFKKLDP